MWTKCLVRLSTIYISPMKQLKTCWIFIRNTTFMLHLLPDYSCNDDGLIAQDQRLFEIRHDIWTTSFNMYTMWDWTPKENINFKFGVAEKLKFSFCNWYSFPYASASSFSKHVFNLLIWSYSYFVKNRFK